MSKKPDVPTTPDPAGAFEAVPEPALQEYAFATPAATPACTRMAGGEIQVGACARREDDARCVAVKYGRRIH